MPGFNIVKNFQMLQERAVSRGNSKNSSRHLNGSIGNSINMRASGQYSNVAPVNSDAKDAYQSNGGHVISQADGAKLRAAKMSLSAGGMKE